MSSVISVYVIFIFSQVNGNLVNGMFELKSLRTSQANWAVVFLFSEVETQDVERVLSRPSWLAQDFHILISRALLLSLLLLVAWKDSWRAAAHFVNLPRPFSRIFWFIYTVYFTTLQTASIATPLYIRIACAYRLGHLQWNYLGIQLVVLLQLITSYVQASSDASIAMHV